MTFNVAKKSNANAEEYCKGGLIFKSLDDYISIWNIDNWLHSLYTPNPECNVHDEYCFKPSLIINSGFRESEELFYNNLRDVSKLIDGIEPFCFQSLDETAFAEMCPNITALHYEEDFKYNNKKIERKFKRISHKLCGNSICPGEF